MLSVVIDSDESERSLVATMAPLVAGATAALVTEVIVADSGSREAIAAIADYAGCHLVVSSAAAGARLARAAATARAQWVLFLQAGDVLQPGWIEEVSRFIEERSIGRTDNEFVAVFRELSPPRAAASPLREAAGLIAQAIGLRRAPTRGLLLQRRLYQKIGGHSPNAVEPRADLLRRLGRRRVVVLRSGANAL